jgi:hypothetical protein
VSRDPIAVDIPWPSHWSRDKYWAYPRHSGSTSNDPQGPQNSESAGELPNVCLRYVGLQRTRAAPLAQTADVHRTASKVSDHRDCTGTRSVRDPDQMRTSARGPSRPEDPGRALRDQATIPGQVDLSIGVVSGDSEYPCSITLFASLTRCPPIQGTEGRLQEPKQCPSVSGVKGSGQLREHLPKQRFELPAWQPEVALRKANSDGTPLRDPDQDLGCGCAHHCGSFCRSDHVRRSEPLLERRTACLEKSVDPVPRDVSLALAHGWHFEFVAGWWILADVTCINLPLFRGRRLYTAP